MRTHSDPDVERILKLKSNRRARELRAFRLSPQVHPYILPTLLNPQPFRRGNVRLNFMRSGTLRIAELQRGQPISMKRSIRVGRIRVQALPDHQNRFTVRLLALPNKRHFRSQRNIPGDFLPDKVEVIPSKPHILATAGNRVPSRARIVSRRPFVENLSNIAMIVEETETHSLFLPEGSGFSCHARESDSRREGENGGRDEKDR